MPDESQRRPIVFVDGCRQDGSAIQIDWDDPGFARGFGAFETVALVGGKAVFLDAHHTRLNQSCRLLGIAAPTAHALLQQTHAALAAWDLSEGILRIQQSASGRTILAIQAPRPQRSEISARALTWMAPPYPPARAKHTSRAGASMATKALATDEVIRADRDGCALEGTWSNIFCLQDGTLYTCPDDGRILPGVTRAVVLSLAREAGVPIQHEAPALKLQSSEWFATSSLAGIVPIGTLDGRQLPAPSSTVSALQAALNEQTGRTASRTGPTTTGHPRANWT